MNRFKRATTKYKVVLPEIENFKFAQNGLKFRLRKKFDAIEFRDLVELIARVSRYETLLEEENERNSSSLKTYYKDPNYEINVAQLIGEDPFTCKSLVKKNVSIESYKTKGSFKKYSFNIHKADEIFDHLLESKVLKLPNNVELPSKEDMKGKKLIL